MYTRINIKFAAIPGWTYEGKEPSKYTFFEAIALAGLENTDIRLDAATQKKLLGANVFGNRRIRLTADGSVICTISRDFGRDYESLSYTADTVQQAAMAGKQLRPSHQGAKYHDAR